MKSSTADVRITWNERGNCKDVCTELKKYLPRNNSSERGGETTMQAPNAELSKKTHSNFFFNDSLDPRLSNKHGGWGSVSVTRTNSEEFDIQNDANTHQNTTGGSSRFCPQIDVYSMHANQSSHFNMSIAYNMQLLANK